MGDDAKTANPPVSGMMATTGNYQRAFIIVPTYNEAQNIKALMDAILNQDTNYRDMTGVTLRILVVDDSSPDGTADIVRQYQEKDPRVHLLLRTEKKGLGAAYVGGMIHALKELDPDIVIEMDADFSHDPEDIYRLIHAIKRGAHFVIGSRYVEGGSIPEDWGTHRKLISAAANAFSRIVLGIGDVKDCTGGFRAMRATALRTIDLDNLDATGYVFQVSLLDAFIRKGYSVQEVPIAFSDRAAGQSKMRASDMIDGGMSLLRLRIDRFTDSARTGVEA